MTQASFSLTPGKRVLFLTKDAEIIRKQLRGEIDLQMKDVDPADLLDDINTDVMTPAWVCFNWQPLEIAREAYAGLIVDGKRVSSRPGQGWQNTDVVNARATSATSKFDSARAPAGPVA